MTRVRAGYERGTRGLIEINYSQNTIEIILKRPMTSQSVPGQALNAADPSSYITEENSRREQPDDFTCRPVFSPTTRCGAYFLPMEMPSRDLEVKSLPQTPLELFQLFLPYSLVKSWVRYTNSWVQSLLQSRHLGPASRLRGWYETSVAEVYVWLAILIYIGIHKESTIHRHWETSSLGHQGADHSIRKYLTYDRFQLLQRHIRVFNPFNIADTQLPKVFQAVDDWSEHIQRVSLELWTPGTNIAVDECMTRFTGRSYETTKVPNKPTPSASSLGLWPKKASSYGGFGTSRRRDTDQLVFRRSRAGTQGRRANFLVSYAVRDEEIYIRLSTRLRAWSLP
ncbi:hypothetical protein MRS44_017833 [Fusarium solani]|uniref:uncharacterized protein n=1 Tax=Fusarium solani TaxID=169388 RepID=UPI0032C43946|nr:hypothetical protein MRS44_017833 [Fusarium solani]